MQQFQTHKAQVTQTRIVDVSGDLSAADLEEGEILVKIDRFAFTANNITYAIAGHTLKYWNFFPPVGEGTEDWGVIPVWGFAEVVASQSAAIPLGERLYGYFQPASFLVMRPTRVSDRIFIEGSAHRADLPAGYNLYRRVGANPHYNPAMDNATMMFAPLHLTAFCLWDHLQEQAWFGAKQIALLSASSKTSLGLAYALQEDEAAPTTIGITSARHVAALRELDLYGKTLSYDTLSKLDPTLPTVLVDMSGNQQVLDALYAHLGEQLRRCVSVGLTHWENSPASPPRRERSKFFFAPSHIQQRIQDWGPQAFEQKTGRFVMQTAMRMERWFSYKTLHGLNELAEQYPAVCAGILPLNQGIVVQM